MFIMFTLEDLFSVLFMILTRVVVKYCHKSDVQLRTGTELTILSNLMVKMRACT